MSGHATFVPGVGLVTVVPGRGEKRLYVLEPTESLRYVTETASDAPDPRADTPTRSHSVKTGWVDRGLLAVLAVGAVAVVVDGLVLLGIAWIFR